MAIRSAAKAVIIHKGKLLLNHCVIEGKKCYTLPGGGQRQYEDMEDAVVRECLEETGYTVIPEGFMALYEEIRDDAETRKKFPDYTHCVFHVFLCRLADENLRPPTEQDFNQSGIEWLDLNALDGVSLLPERLHDHIRDFLNDGIAKFHGTKHIS